MNPGAQGRFALIVGVAGVLSASAPAHELVIYGGTSAGVAAAAQAARQGRSVILVSPDRHLGGLSSGGLGMTDAGDHAAIGGLAREFYRRLKKHYDEPAAWTREPRATFEHWRAADETIWRFEPKVAEAVFEALIREANVPVVRGERLDLVRGVDKVGARIVRIRMESGREFAGSVFIDATYEGDLMAKSGVAYTVGRESGTVYGETLNGVRTRESVNHQFTRPVDPFVMPGDPASGLLPEIQSGGAGDEGAGDRRIQAYCFRMCLTDDPANRVPIPKPAGYDPRRYELLRRYLTPEWNDIFGNHARMPNRKTDTNNHGAFGTDHIGANGGYPDGDYATRDRIIRDHIVYQQGLLWFLAHDPRVPATVRDRVNRWGLARDEFTDTGNWPRQLYVRESRRMISDHVQTERDCLRSRPTPDPVGLGSYNMDSHNVQRYVDAEGHARNEGNIEVSPGGAYAISYRAIRPRAAECANLLVPVCLAASHIAYGSIRMEPVFMILGQSAASAAAIALERGVTVQEVPYADLKARLLAGGQVLDLPGATGGRVDPGELAGIVVDDPAAELAGAWAGSATVGPFVGAGYIHDLDRDKGTKTARYSVRLPASGRYDVQVAYTPHENRATNVPVRIVHSKGFTDVVVNQRTPPGLDRVFASVGVYTFAKGEAVMVTISTGGTDGHVIADAVRFVPAP